MTHIDPPAFDLPPGYHFVGGFHILYAPHESEDGLWHIGRIIAPDRGSAPLAPACEVVWPFGFEEREDAKQACKVLEAEDRMAVAYENQRQSDALLDALLTGSGIYRMGRAA